MAASQSDWTTTKVNAIWDGASRAVQFTVVKRVLSTTDGKIHVTPITAATDKPYGVIQETPLITEACTVIVIGGTKLAVGAIAVTAGSDIMVDATGYAKIYATGAGTSWDFGVFDAAGAANAITSGVINCASCPKGV